MSKAEDLNFKLNHVKLVEAMGLEITDSNSLNDITSQFFLFFGILGKIIQVSYSCIQNSKYITDTVENKSLKTSFGMYITSPISSFLQNCKWTDKIPHVN
jgi:hypothetical protein